MRGRRTFVSQLLVCAGLALTTAACGGSGGAPGGPDPGPLTGNAILQGSVHGAANGVEVAIVGTALSAAVDEDGQFALSSVPAGSVTLRFQGGGADARLTVDGLQDGLVTSIDVALTGATAQLTTPPSCAPTANTFFSGNIDQVADGRIVVSGRPVDTSEIRKVWRGERRIQLGDLQLGEKVKVWGLLRGDGVMVAEEIAALTRGGGGGDVWASFSGTIETVSASALAARDVHANPNSSYYPTVVVAGRTVRTNDQTKFKWSDGNALDPRDLEAGQKASVEGWKKTDGTVQATGFVVEGTGSPAKPAWVSFRGRVDSVVALDRSGRVVELGAGGVRASCNLKLTIAGRRVESDGSTAYKWSDGSELDPYAIVVGDQASVEGWSQPEGYVQATKLVVNKR